MERWLWNIMARNGEAKTGGRLCARGRSVVRVDKASVVIMVPDHDGAIITVAVPFHMNKSGKGGLLLLDHNRGWPAAREMVRDGVSNCQSHFDVWPSGPQERGRYSDMFEQFARVDWPASLADGAKPRPAFELTSSEDVGRELAMRVLVDPAEVQYPEPEDVILGSVSRMQAGHFDGMPAVLHSAGSRIQLKATNAAIITKVTKGEVVLKNKRWYRTIPVPEGLEVHPRIRPGRKIRRGQALFQVGVSDRRFEGLPVATALVEALRLRIFADDRGRKLIRLGYATAVAHHCAQCNRNNGVYPVVALLCPGCGARVDRARLAGGVHVPNKEVKSEMQLECVRCKHTESSEAFRQHRVCGGCGAASLPSLKKAYLSCNSRHYAVRASGTGTYIQNPLDVSYVQSYIRRLKQDGTSLREVAQSALCRTTAPVVTYVA